MLTPWRGAEDHREGYAPVAKPCASLCTLVGPYIELLMGFYCCITLYHFAAGQRLLWGLDVHGEVGHMMGLVCPADPGSSRETRLN
jgi:hypothetical protein